MSRDKPARRREGDVTGGGSAGLEACQQVPLPLIGEARSEEERGGGRVVSGNKPVAACEPALKALRSSPSLGQGEMEPSGAGQEHTQVLE